MMDQPGTNVGVQYSTSLFGKDWAKSVRGRLKQLCFQSGLDFEEV